MTKRELWKMFDRYRDGGIGKQDLMDAVDAYSSASNGSKPPVSGSLPDKKFTIDFSGNILAMVETQGDIRVLAAMDGWGNGISIDTIKVQRQ